MIDLLGTPERVTGVLVRSGDAEVPVTAARVVLASGGFEHDQGLREEYLPLPTEADWSTSGARNRGELLNLAVAHGAATAGLDDAWWVPVMLVDGVAFPLDEVRGKPHSVIVDSAGDRFFDESTGQHRRPRCTSAAGCACRAVLPGDGQPPPSKWPLGPWTATACPGKRWTPGIVRRPSTWPKRWAWTGPASWAPWSGSTGSPAGKDLDFKRSGRPGAPGNGKRRNPSLGKLDNPFWAVSLRRRRHQEVW